MSEENEMGMPKFIGDNQTQMGENMGEMERIRPKTSCYGTLSVRKRRRQGKIIQQLGLS